MKQMLLVFVLGIMLASCGTGGGDDVVSLRKQLDSLAKLVPANAKPGQNARFSTSVGAAKQYSVAPTAASYLVMADGANSQIQEWHAIVKNNPALRWSVNKSRTAFMVPGNTLDTLINSMGCQYVVFYIGMDQQGTGEISLFYTGVQQTDDTTLNEVELKNAAGAKCVFDQTYPCPKCDKIGIHVSSAGIGGVPPATIFSTVVDDGGGANGSITPEGNKTYYNTTSAKYSFVPASGYTVDVVKVDGQLTPTDGKSHTFKDFTGSHDITVKFKPAQ